MMPGGYSLQTSDTTTQTAASKGANEIGSAGGQRGIFNTFAFPGAAITTDASGSTAPPIWVWLALGGAALAVVWVIKRK